MRLAYPPRRGVMVEELVARALVVLAGIVVVVLLCGVGS